MGTKIELTPASFESSEQSWVPQTEADREAIREHLKQIFATHYFKTSKRYPAFLRHVVDEALNGRAETLKERTLGVEVFHRNPSYDTNLDPVVRTAACEVRKRLGQYYSAWGSEQDIRIELPLGSYVPEFRRRANGHEVNSTAGPKMAPEIEEPRHSVGTSAPWLADNLLRLGRRNYLTTVIVLAIGFCLGVVGAIARPWMQNSAVDDFWRPLVKSPGVVLICMGELYSPEIRVYPNGALTRFASPIGWSAPPAQDSSLHPVVTLSASITLANVATFLRSENKPFVIRGNSTTTFADLGKGPAVLVGGFSNDWTLRLNDQLRYYFDIDTNSGQVWIADRQKPAEKFGTRSIGTTTSENREEFALISRVRDPSTHQMVVSLAGITGVGTRAAADFVTSEDYLESLGKQDLTKLEHQNLQIVIALNVVDKSPGPPRFVTSYSW